MRLYTSATRKQPRIPRISTRNLYSYDSPHRLVTVIPGDGIGPEITSSALGVLQASGAPVAFDILDQRTYRENILAGEVIASISRNQVALKGPLYTPPGTKGEPSRNNRLRNRFNLFANLVHLKTFDGVPAKNDKIDIVVVRENMEGEYTGMESEVVPGVVQSLKITTASKSRAIAEHAFQYAVNNGRKKVTAVHKANIMKLTDGLFLEECRKVAKKFPGINFNEMIIDNTCMQLVMNPLQFDVILTPNLYGNIVVNVVAGLIGGAGLPYGSNIGPHVSIFEPGARHVGHNISGQNIANPTGMIMSGVMLLKHLGMNDYADRISRAVSQVISSPQTRTKDLGGIASTKEFTFEIIKKLNAI